MFDPKLIEYGTYISLDEVFFNEAILTKWRIPTFTPYDYHRDLDYPYDQEREGVDARLSKVRARKTVRARQGPKFRERKRRMEGG